MTLEAPAGDPPLPPRLVGRNRELAAIDRLMSAAARGNGGSAIVTGGPGIGKTLFLEEVTKRAPSAFTVLRCFGTSSETAVPFAGLHQLLHPLQAHLEGLPSPQVSALKGVFGLSGSPADGLSVPCAALALLDSAAQRAPLLLVVDDAHRMDEASLNILAFVARRLQNIPVAMLVAARDHDVTQRRLGGLPEVRLEPLPPADIRLLVTRTVEDVTERLVDRLVRESAGNPLVVTELVAALPQAVASGAVDPPEELPCSPRLRTWFGALVAELPRAAQTMLLTAAANDCSDLYTVLSAASSLDLDTAELSVLERSGLVSVVGDELVFQPPFLRTIVYRNSTLAERKLVHHALAKATGNNVCRQAHHLAAATHEPDEDVAQKISASAGQARKVNGMMSALRLLERAAALSSDPAVRARLLITAATCAWQAGLPLRARELEQQIDHSDDDPHLLAAAGLLRGSIAHTRVTPIAAHRILLDSARHAALVAPELAAHLLVMAARTTLACGDLAKLGEIGRRLVELGLKPDHPARLFGTAMRRLAALDLRRSGDLDASAEGALRLLSEGEPTVWPSALPYVPVMSGAAQEAYAQVLEVLRAQGATGALPMAATSLIALQHMVGRWDEAVALGDEMLLLAEQTGQEGMQAKLQALLAMLAGTRGDTAHCRKLATQALQGSASGRDHATLALAHWALGRSALSSGDPYSAILHYSRITAPHDSAHHFMIAFMAIPDLVECHVMANQFAEAKAALQAAERWRLDATTPYLLGPLLRARALLAPGAEEAELLLNESIQHLKDCPFERARTELQLGKLLRRERRIRDARRHLHTAVETFTSLRAVPWLEQAAAELRAAGYDRDPDAKKVQGTAETLTPQELRIAQLASQGLTNPEIALRLSISPSTVRYHLSKIFQKLQITSRRQLLQSELYPEGDPTPAPGSAIGPSVNPVPSPRTPTVHTAPHGTPPPTTNVHIERPHRDQKHTIPLPGQPTGRAPRRRRRGGANRAY